MLVINRYQGEKITIDNNIEITILGSRGIVNVGIEAPKNIKVLREELRRSNSYKSIHLNYPKILHKK